MGGEDLTRKDDAMGGSLPRSAPRNVVRQPMVCASRFSGVRTHPLYKECASPRACALDTRRRPDAAASTASRPATSDDREPLLVKWDEMNRNIITCPNLSMLYGT